MELRSRRERLLQKGRPPATLGFRSTKKLLQLQDKDLPPDSKARRLLAETKERLEKTWPPACDNKTSPDHAGEKLPEKLLLLEEMYHSMEAAISLLRMRRNICTFSTIATAVEISTHRRFLRTHLAQIKYILEEVLQVEEHLAWDAESQCSRRDLRITLHPIQKEEPAAMQRSKSPQKPTDMVMRRKEFRRRLREFYHKNKESDVDVPQAPLLAGGATSHLGECNADLSQPLPARVEDTPTRDELCALPERDKILYDDGDEAIDADSCDSAPLPIAFDLSQLKKFPRSPSKLCHQQRISPAPPHSSMSHLPAVFKPHFSVKGHTALADPYRSKALETAMPFAGSTVDVKPQFFLKRCDNVIGPPTPATPQKELSQPLPDKRLADCEAASSQPIAATPPVPELMSPPACSVLKDCSRTPTHYESPMLSTSFTSPSSTMPACTPQQAILTPAALTTPSVTAAVKEIKDMPMKNRKQTVIKSLRFGTPKKHVIAEKPRPGSTEKAETPCAISDGFFSPIKSPSNELPSAPKKGDINVNRVLPFNSPVGKNRERSRCLETGVHAPKRVKLCSPCSRKLESFSNMNDEVRADESDNALHADDCQAENSVDLLSISHADGLSVSDVEILKCLPQELLNDVQAKERKQLKDKLSGIEKTRRRQQLVAGLPKLFNSVRLIFQSENRTVLTRKDLTKMVLSSHPDITDQGEIVEQLHLLVELAPQWISANRSSTGDSLYRINKNADMRAVSKALFEARWSS